MRERIIIEELINNNKYLDLNYFSQNIGVSTRTIRNNIKNIEKDAKKNGFNLVYKAKLGYILEIDDYKKFEKYKNNLNSDLIEIPQQRIISIIVELSLIRNYKTIDYLSKKFLVSGSQIKNDLKKVDNILEKFDLKLERRAHYGIKIEGSIQSIQKILLDAYFQGNSNLKENINKFIDNKKFEIIKNQLKNILSKYDLQVNLNDFEEILAEIVIMYVKFSMKQLENNCKLNLDVKNKVMKDLMENIFQDKKYYIEIEEYNYLRNFIKLKTKSKKAKLESINKNELEQIICNFFKEVDKKYYTNFLDDKEFFNLFYLHIASLIERAKMKQNGKNYFLVKISQQYPTAFNLSIKFSKILENTYKIKINEDEIGFIATYIALLFEKKENTNLNKKYKIAIICSSGGGSSYIIKLRLKEIFSNSDIRNFSLLDEQKVLNFNPDLIFSITDLSFKINALVIRINEILDEFDYINIKKSIQLKNLEIDISNPNKYIFSLFSKNHFICIKEKEDYKSIIYKMSEKIVTEGICASTYPSDVWERESYLSTIYTNGVSIPHPIEMTGTKNIISIGLVQCDISNENKNVKIIFMVSLIKESLEIHKQISKYLTNIMADKDLVDKLSKSQSYEEFIYKLKLFIGGGNL